MLETRPAPRKGVYPLYRVIHAQDPIITAEFDASLSRAGIISYVREACTEVARGATVVSLSFLGFGDDSSYQSLAELPKYFTSV